MGAAVEVAEKANFVARVNITNVTDLDACNYDVSYNAAVLEVTHVTSAVISGTVIPVSSWGFVPSGIQGTARVIQNVPGVPGVTGSGYLAEIHLHIIGSPGNTSALDLSNGIVGDKNAHGIPATCSDGSVRVGGASEAVAASAPPPAAPTIEQSTSPPQPASVPEEAQPPN